MAVSNERISDRIDRIAEIIWSDSVEKKAKVIIPAIAVIFLAWLIYQLCQAIRMGVL